MTTYRGCTYRLARMLVTCLLVVSPHLASADEEKEADEASSKFRPFAEVTKGAEAHQGLFTLYKKDEHLYAVIKPEHLDMPLLAPIAIARGMASAGMPLNFGDEWVLTFRRAGDRLHLVRKNVHYEAPENSPLSKAVEQNYTDSVLMALPIISTDAPSSGLLVDFSEVFLSDFAGLGVGSLDRSRSTWHKIKTFENNIELQVAATFSRGGYGYYGYYDDGVVDGRGVTLVVHYSLAKIPGNGYQPRLADQRVGHFLNATKDFGSKDPETNFVRRINRWHFEKSDPSAELSVPKKQLVWWVEDTVPHEYRPYVEEGILEWNKAFEKIGFRNAIGVRWQNERDDFDPEDINYCTFRWITTPYTFAMSGLRSNPITGEMIDGDVVFDASWIKYWMNEYAMLVGKPVSQEAANHFGPLDVGEIISPMLAARRGFGLPQMPAGAHSHEHGHPNLDMPRAVPSSWSPLHAELQQRCSPAHCATCQYSTAKRHEFRLAALALAAAVKEARESKKKDEEKADDKDEDDKETEAEFELPKEFIGQAIKEIVMHEVGHSLGLRHNFKASAMLSQDELNNTDITREKGMSGSVMDYNPINIAPPGTEQGDYASTTIGPYDYWAIEYAYKPISGDEEAELAKIAARSPDADLIYATDEDMWMSNDPLVNTYDLGNDPLAYGRQRIELANNLLDKLDDKVIKDGQSWARLRSAFSMLLAQYGNAAYLASSHIGGQYFSRDFKGGENSRDPVVPVSGEKQREALELLTTEILSDDAFEFDPALLRRLTMEHWYHWGSDMMYFGGGVDFPVYDRVLSIQRIALNQCLDAGVLRRVQNHTLLSEQDADPIQMEEIFSKLTDAVWADLEATDDDDEPLKLSVIRRNLQREHLRKLCTMVIGTPRSPYYDLYDYIYFSGSSSSYPADAKSLARLHLRNLHQRLSELLEDEDLETDDTTRAHLSDAREQIGKALDARLQANDY